MPEFHVFDFLTVLLDPLVILHALILGLAMGAGWVVATGERLPVHTIYWIAVRGTVFFVPLALLRGVQGSDTWERLLATWPLWLIYAGGMWVGDKAIHRLRRS